MLGVVKVEGGLLILEKGGPINGRYRFYPSQKGGKWNGRIGRAPAGPVPTPKAATSPTTAASAEVAQSQQPVGGVKKTKVNRDYIKRRKSHLAKAAIAKRCTSAAQAAVQEEAQLTSASSSARN